MPVQFEGAERLDYFVDRLSVDVCRPFCAISFCLFRRQPAVTRSASTWCFLGNWLSLLISYPGAVTTVCPASPEVSYICLLRVGATRYILSPSSVLDGSFGCEHLYIVYLSGASPGVSCEEDLLDVIRLLCDKTLREGNGPMSNGNGKTRRYTASGKQFNCRKNFTLIWRRPSSTAQTTVAAIRQWKCFQRGTMRFFPFLLHIYVRDARPAV